MCVRTDTGFDYGDKGVFTREEQTEYVQSVIDNCEDGAYL